MRETIGSSRPTAEFIRSLDTMSYNEAVSELNDALVNEKISHEEWKTMHDNLSSIRNRDDNLIVRLALSGSTDKAEKILDIVAANRTAWLQLIKQEYAGTTK